MTGIAWVFVLALSMITTAFYAVTTWKCWPLDIGIHRAPRCIDPERKHWYFSIAYKYYPKGWARWYPKQWIRSIQLWPLRAPNWWRYRVIPWFWNRKRETRYNIAKWQYMQLRELFANAPITDEGDEIVTHTRSGLISGTYTNSWAFADWINLEIGPSLLYFEHSGGEYWHEWHWLSPMFRDVMFWFAANLLEPFRFVVPYNPWEIFHEPMHSSNNLEEDGISSRPLRGQSAQEDTSLPAQTFTDCPEVG